MSITPGYLIFKHTFYVQIFSTPLQHMWRLNSTRQSSSLGFFSACTKKSEWSKSHTVHHYSNALDVRTNGSHDDDSKSLFFASFLSSRASIQKQQHFSYKRNCSDENSSQLSFGARTRNTESCRIVWKRVREKIFFICCETSSKVKHIKKSILK